MARTELSPHHCIGVELSHHKAINAAVKLAEIDNRIVRVFKSYGSRGKWKICYGKARVVGEWEVYPNGEVFEITAGDEQANGNP